MGVRKTQAVMVKQRGIGLGLSTRQNEKNGAIKKRRGPIIAKIVEQIFRKIFIS